jgi:hypothetical protein
MELRCWKRTEVHEYILHNFIHPSDYKIKSLGWIFIIGIIYC